jgi:hypothetical protein
LGNRFFVFARNAVAGAIVAILEVSEITRGGFGPRHVHDAAEAVKPRVAGTIGQSHINARLGVIDLGGPTTAIASKR